MRVPQRERSKELGDDLKSRTITASDERSYPISTSCLVRWKIAIRENNTDDGHLQHLDLEDVELVIFELFSKMGVSKNRWFSPQIIHLNRGFPLITNHPFWFFPPYFRKHPNGSVGSPESLVEKVAGISSSCCYMVGPVRSVSGWCFFFWVSKVRYPDFLIQVIFSNSLFMCSSIAMAVRPGVTVWFISPRSLGQKATHFDEHIFQPDTRRFNHLDYHFSFFHSAFSFVHFACLVGIYMYLLHLKSWLKRGSIR